MIAPMKSPLDRSTSSCLGAASMRGPTLLGSFVAAALASLTSSVARADDAPPSAPAPSAVAAPAPAPVAPPVVAVVPLPPPSDPMPGTTPAVGGTTSAPSATDVPHDYWREHTAGYYGGQFYLRSEDDAFVLYPMARLQMDTYAFAGPGVSDYQKGNGSGGLKLDMFAKRSRVEMQGRFMHDFYFMLAGDFAYSAQSTAAQTNASNAVPSDVFIGYDAHKLFAVQVGQFDTPFTNENLWTDKFFDFMERSLTVRAVGNPYNKDLGVLFRGENGETNRGQYGYAVAVVGGGGMNRTNDDNRVDVMGRVFVRPLAGSGSPMEQFHIGVSGRYGQRDPAYVHYQAPALSTPGGYTFFPSQYGSGATLTDVIPDGNQEAFAADIFLPFGAFDLKSEFVYLNEGRREALDATPLTIQRTGTLSGTSYYVSAAYWLFGKPRYNPGNPGIGSLPKRRLDEKSWDNSLQIVARWEQVSLNYDSINRNTQVAQVKSGLDGGIKVNDFQLAANFWASKHVRITGEWSLYMFPGTPVGANGSIAGISDANRAVAPGTAASAKDASASVLHEFSARVAIDI